MDTIFSSANSSQKSAIKIIRVSGKGCDKIPEIFSSAFDDFIERYEMEHGDAVVEYEAKIMNKV